MVANLFKCIFIFHTIEIYGSKDPSIVRDRLSSRKPDRAIAKGIGSLLSKRQREIEKEISEYLELNKSHNKGYEMSM